MTTYEVIAIILIFIIAIIGTIAIAKTYQEEKKEKQFKKEQLTAIQQDLNYLRKKVEELEKEDKK